VCPSPWNEATLACAPARHIPASIFSHGYSIAPEKLPFFSPQSKQNTKLVMTSSSKYVILALLLGREMLITGIAARAPYRLRINL